MIEVVVLILWLPGETRHTYIFDDFIIKEHIYDPWLDSITENRFEIYDLNTDNYYVVPKNENVKVLQQKIKPVFGLWSVEGKTVTIIDTVQSTYEGFICVIETASTTTDTPFGASDGKQIKYYADLSPVIPFKEEVILYILGVREFKYDPHLFLVKTEQVYDERTITIMSVDVNKEKVERARFEEVLGYPVRFD